MPVTVGSTLTGINFPTRHSGLGPFKSSAGAYYFFGRSAASGVSGQERMYKTTDPMAGTWSVAGVTNPLNNAGTTVGEAMAAYQVGDLLHCVTQNQTGTIFYRQFDMATDAWVNNDVVNGYQTVYTVAFLAGTVGYTWVSLAVRSTGEVVLAFAYGMNATMSGFNKVGFKRRSTGGVWADNAGGTGATAATVFDQAAASTNYANPIAVLGGSDRIHLFWKDITLNDYYHRTLSSANALQTVGTAYSPDAASGQVMSAAQGFSYNDAGTTKVVLPQSRSLNSEKGVVRIDSTSDTPTLTWEAATTAGHTNSGGQITLGADHNGTTVEYLYADSTLFDLFRDENTGAGWGTDVSEWTGVGNITQFTTGVYARSGTKLAIIANDAATLKYGEVSLAAAPTLTQNTFRGRNDDGTETTATWKAIAGADWTQAVDTNFRVRFLVQSAVAAPTQNTAFQLRYSLNGGAYTAVSGASTVVQAIASPNITDGVATTEQLAGSGTFNAGTIDEVDGSATGFTAATATGHDTEVEYVLTIPNADVVDGDIINLRLYVSNAVINAYTDTPVITVTEPVVAVPEVISVSQPITLY